MTSMDLSPEVLHYVAFVYALGRLDQWAERNPLPLGDPKRFADLVGAADPKDYRALYEQLAALPRPKLEPKAA